MNFIINPLNNKQYFINSVEGKRLLKKFIKASLNGGMNENLQHDNNDIKIQFVKELNKGSYGQANIVKRINDGKLIVQKKSLMPTHFKNGLQEDILKELIVLTNIRHVNIIQPEKPFIRIDGKEEVSIFLEKMDGDIASFFHNNIIYKYLQNLTDNNMGSYNLRNNWKLILSSKSRYYFGKKTMTTNAHSQYNLPKELYKDMSINIIQNFFKQINDGLVALHSNGLVHSDLKPENILYKIMPNNKFRIKITDFGLSEQRLMPQYKTQCITTAHFSPPECKKIKEKLTNESKPLFKIDSYSLAVLIYAFIMSIIDGFYQWNERYILPDPNDNNYLTKLNSKLTELQNQPFVQQLEFKGTQLITLLRNMLKYNVNERFTCMQVSIDPFFQDSQTMYTSVFDNLGYKQQTYKGGVFLDIQDPNYARFSDNYYYPNKADWDIQKNDLVYLEKSFEIFNKRCEEDSVVNYLKTDTKIPLGNEVTNTMLNVLHEWLIEVLDIYRKESDALSNELFPLYLHIENSLFINLYKQNKHMERNKLQGYGTMLMHLAWKCNAYLSPQLKDWRHITDDAHTVDELQEFELFILKTINGKIEIIPYYFFAYYYYSKYLYEFESKKNFGLNNNTKKQIYENILLNATTFLLDFIESIKYPKNLLNFISVLFEIVKNSKKHKYVQKFIKHFLKIHSWNRQQIIECITKIMSQLQKNLSKKKKNNKPFKIILMVTKFIIIKI